MKKAQAHTDTEVLFQKLGSTWYAFSQIGEEIVFSALPAGVDPRTQKVELYEVIEEHLEKVAQAEAA